MKIAIKYTKKQTIKTRLESEAGEEEWSETIGFIIMIVDET
ncbi:hypothetical protein [Acinetobacter sp. YH12070]|nr:hypothetical protein [Acinetobacter sp. YH12070]